MFHFTSLPTELQFQVLDFLPTSALLNVSEVNRHFNSLAISKITFEIHDLTSPEKGVFISVFSPQNKDRLVETFNTICVSNPNTKLNTPSLEKGTVNRGSVDMNLVADRLEQLKSIQDRHRDQPMLFQTVHQSHNVENSVFQLGNLEFTRDPLKSSNTSVPVDHSSNELNLIVNEDEPFIKLHFEMHQKKNGSLTSLFKFNSRLRQLDSASRSSGTLYSANKAASVDYVLEKGEELPPRGDYDYDVFYKYKIKFGNFTVKNSYLLSCAEV